MTTTTFIGTEQFDHEGFAEYPSEVSVTVQCKHADDVTTVNISMMTTHLRFMLRVVGMHRLAQADIHFVVVREFMPEMVLETRPLVDITETVNYFADSALRHFEHGRVSLSDKMFRKCRDVIASSFAAALQTTY